MNAQQKVQNEGIPQEEIYTQPYKLFTLSNRLIEEEDEVANFYTFQKVFQGEFQVTSNNLNGNPACI